MPRRKKKDLTRDVGLDPRFGSAMVQKFINVLMERGKKDIARSVVYGAIDLIAEKVGRDEKKALEVFNKAMNQVMPFIEVRPRRVGGSVYQIPKEVPPKRKNSLAMRWIKTAAQARSGKTMKHRLAHELLDAYDGKGGAIKRRTEVQRMAEANRAFSHLAW